MNLNSSHFTEDELEREHILSKESLKSIIKPGIKNKNWACTVLTETLQWVLHLLSSSNKKDTENKFHIIIGLRPTQLYAIIADTE